MTYTAEQLSVMDSIISRYPRKRSAIMPLLHYVQSIEGYVTNEGIELIGQKLELATAEVTAVSTFYTQYKSKPVGEYHVGICTNTLCAVMGGDAIFESIKEHLDIENDGVTGDGKVSVLAGISDGLANEGIQAGEPSLLGLKKAKGGA